MKYRSLASLDRALVKCEKCPRLVSWREEVAEVKRKAYKDERYWGKPVPGFGVEEPKILIVGLAPGAHGANRTGRIFTGDSSVIGFIDHFTAIVWHRLRRVQAVMMVRNSSVPGSPVQCIALLLETNHRLRREMHVPHGSSRSYRWLMGV